MKQKLLNDHQQTVTCLMSQGQNLLREMGQYDRAAQIADALKEAQSRQKPTIMFYGLYNAGKSTLINAIFQNKIAEVGPVPTTAASQAVDWDGYTLLDTPGINAKDEHTQIAEQEIDSSDLILFVLDNMDGFERKIVYQVIVDILLRQKAVAVVINQKDIKDDETELPTSEQPSLQKIAARVMENLHRQAQSVGYELVDNGKLFLGIFMVNAQMALDALNEPIAEDRDMIYQDAGIYSLSHTINETLRASSRVRMLMTPVTNLKKTLEEARIAYQQDELFGSKSEYAKAREILAEARQRTQERLMSEGLLKIEGCFDRVRCLAESGKPYKQEMEQLQQDLVELIQHVAGQETKNTSAALKALNIPEIEQPAAVSSSTGEVDADLSELGNWLEGSIACIPSLPIPPEYKWPIMLISFIIAQILKDGKNKDGNKDQARRDAERMAAYYKWLNELRNSEEKVKATYTDSVQTYLADHYDAQIAELGQKLAQVSDACEAHIRIATQVDQLLLSAGNEIAELALAL